MSKPARTNTVNLIVDIIIGVVMLVVLSPALTGIAIHEWLSLALTATLILHLLLHWDWLLNVTRRFFKRLGSSVRINAILNIGLFIATTVAMLSGILISEVALKTFGISTQRGGVWRGLHGTSATVVLILLGLHVALHWRWVVHTCAQVFGMLARRPQRAATALPTSTQDLSA